ncbi:hypothetical protein, partial [Salmonella sp. SAL4355]|uniref:hypothetical protein n=1 Tax=Salmonella sp. SAL4355 TaxID=3159876 RepID=UPI00397A62AA
TKVKLLQQAWWIRFLTWVQSFFASLFIDQKYTLEQVEWLVQRDLQRLPSSQHPEQDNLSPQQTATSNDLKKTEPHSSYL